MDLGYEDVPPIQGADDSHRTPTGVCPSWCLRLPSPSLHPAPLGPHPFHQQLRVRVLLPPHRDRLPVVVHLLVHEVTDCYNTQVLSDGMIEVLIT